MLPLCASAAGRHCRLGPKGARPHRVLPAHRHLGVAALWSCTPGLCPAKPYLNLIWP